MIIGICGYGYSGSGAVADFLREWDSCSCCPMDMEFPLLYIPHGIQDLEYELMERKIRYYSSDEALKQFKRLVYAMTMDSRRSPYKVLAGEKFIVRSLALIDQLTQVAWPAYNPAGRYYERALYRSLIKKKMKIIHFYEKWTKKGWTYSKDDTMYLSIAPADFYDNVKSYLQDVLEMLGFDLEKKVLLNQGFDVYDPRRSMKFFDEAKAILVDRDPRDIYILAKCYLKSNACWIPTNNVENFTKYHRLIRNRELPPDRNIIHIRYEDLIYDYENTAQQLRNFLGLSEEEGWQAKKYFDPAVSVNNTQLFLKHPELAPDMRQIEEELPEYVYPFHKFAAKPSFSQGPF